jgi:hypothetical protein
MHGAGLIEQAGAHLLGARTRQRAAVADMCARRQQQSSTSRDLHVSFLAAAARKRRGFATLHTTCTMTRLSFPGYNATGRQSALYAGTLHVARWRRAPAAVASDAWSAALMVAAVLNFATCLRNPWRTGPCAMAVSLMA